MKRAGGAYLSSESCCSDQQQGSALLNSQHKRIQSHGPSSFRLNLGVVGSEKHDTPVKTKKQPKFNSLQTNAYQHNHSKSSCVYTTMDQVAISTPEKPSSLKKSTSESCRQKRSLFKNYGAKN